MNGAAIRREEAAFAKAREAGDSFKAHLLACPDCYRWAYIPKDGPAIYAKHMLCETGSRLADEEKKASEEYHRVFVEGNK